MELTESLCLACEPIMTGDSASAFRFKRFAVHQERAAMKVGIDGILLGAWTDVTHCRRILDVGTGTGLIALMLAQRTEQGEAARIDAVEIDEAAAYEARSNVARSPWQERIHVWHRSVQNLSGMGSYDVVVCNPPYFAGGLSSPDHPRALARHENELTCETLFQLASTVLDVTGSLQMILPADRLETSVARARRDHDLFCRRVMRVKPLPDKPVKRVLLDLRRHEGSIEESEITIEVRHHDYTNAFRALTADFYLSF